MNIFIQTRDVYKDYTFLGNEPKNWWAESYADYTSFEHPTIILESVGSGWQLYLSGAKCSRVDKVNTPIRYSFILNSPNKIADQDLNPVLSLIQLWLVAIDESTSDHLKQKLDDLFDEQKVSQYIALKQDKDRDVKEIDQEISDQFQSWLNQSSDVTVNDIDIIQSQIGAVQSEKAQAQFLNYCAKILRGEMSQECAALYLNFVETKNELELESVKLSDENEYDRQFMILVNNTDHLLKDQLQEVGIKKKVSPAPNPISPTAPTTKKQVPLYQLPTNHQTSNIPQKNSNKLLMILTVVVVGGVLLYLVL